MKTRVIVGTGWALEQACATALEAGIEHCRLVLPSADGYNFDIQALLDSYPRENADVFVALDQRAINSSRHQLIIQVRLAGYRPFNLISPRAIVDAQGMLAGNVHVGPGCNLAAGIEVGLGAWLDRQVILDRDVRLGACVSLMAGVMLGQGVQVGRNSTLSSGTQASAASVVGRQCEWLLGGRLPVHLPDRSFFDELMPDGARVLGTC